MHIEALTLDFFCTLSHLTSVCHKTLSQKEDMSLYSATSINGFLPLIVVVEKHFANLSDFLQYHANSHSKCFFVLCLNSECVVLSVTDDGFVLCSVLTSTCNVFKF